MRYWLEGGSLVTVQEGKDEDTRLKRTHISSAIPVMLSLSNEWRSATRSPYNHFSGSGSWLSRGTGNKNPNIMVDA